MTVTAAASQSDDCSNASLAEAEALVVKAAKELEQLGYRQAFPRFMDPQGEYFPRDLYVFVIDLEGNMWVNGAYPQFIGANALDAVDAKGRRYIEEMLRIAADRREGSVEYQWFNPCTGEYSEKVTYFRRVGRFVVAVGAYRRGGDRPRTNRRSTMSAFDPKQPFSHNPSAASTIAQADLKEIPIAHMTSRRELLLALGAAILAPRSALAQAADRKYRIGVLASSAAVFKDAHWVAFFQRLGELGLAEGRNLVIERRHVDNRLDRLPAAAAELAKLKCDVFFVGGAEATLAALTAASRDTPIVLIAVDFDPIATGDVASLARPGGRVTGVTAIQATMPAKRLELLKEMLPRVSRVAVFTNGQTSEQLSVVQGTSRRMGLALHVVDFKAPPFDYRAGFASAVSAKADALFVLGSGLWVPGRSTIIELARESRLPSVFHHSGWIEAGGLMSYGFSFPALWRRGAVMVAAILRGGKVSSIPMEQPTVFELAVNLKTAKALGIKIPQSILVRADRVIE